MGTAPTEGRPLTERRHLRRDGTRFFPSGALPAMRAETGGLLGFLKIMRDRTKAR